MKKRIALLLVVFVLLTGRSLAEDPWTSVDLNITTSGLYNMSYDRANWITLLNTYVNQRLWCGASLDVDLLAVYNLRDSRGLGNITPELRVFSAIEDETVPLSLFMFGLTQQLGPVSLFFGTRNVNNDYFISPWNSVFTGSTNGLLPVISNEYPLSDSPLSALCFHVEWEVFKNFRIKNSFYNGVAGMDWLDRFRFNPSEDGVMNITEVSYLDEDVHPYVGNYHLGYVIGRVPQEGFTSKKLHQSWFTLVEQPLYIMDDAHRLECVVQGGYSPHCMCDRYLGLGFVWFGLSNREDYLGVIANRTWHDEGDETTIEVTYQISFGEVTLQPAFFQIFSPNNNQSMILLKAGFEIHYEK